MTSSRESREPEGGEADASLVASFLATRSEAAFRALYRRHTPVLYLLARRLLGPRDGAEDAVQDTWVTAARGLATFEGRSSLRTWLSGIVIRRCAEIGRRGSRRREVGIEAILEREAEPRMEIGDALDLERAIRNLPDGYREAIVLHDLEGFTHEEIANLAGTTTGSSKSQLFRARRSLRARMSPEKER